MVGELCILFSQAITEDGNETCNGGSDSCCVTHFPEPDEGWIYKVDIVVKRPVMSFEQGVKVYIALYPTLTVVRETHEIKVFILFFELLISAA